MLEKVKAIYNEYPKEINRAAIVFVAVIGVVLMSYCNR